MPYHSFHQKYFKLFVCLLLFLSGCDLDVLTSNQAREGLTTPRVSINENNIHLVLRRVLWLERLQQIEKWKLQPHALSLFLGNVANQSRGCDRNSSFSCFSCFDGSEADGEIDLRCWTDQAFQGVMTLSVQENLQDSGEATTEWETICGSYDETWGGKTQKHTFCLDGATRYRVLLNSKDACSVFASTTKPCKKNRTTRFDLLWVVGMRVFGEHIASFRLDGVMGFSFEEQNKQVSSSRKAIFFEDASLLYQNLKTQADSGSIELIARNGSFLCQFDRRLTEGSCELKTKQVNESLGASFQWKRRMETK